MIAPASQSIEVLLVEDSPTDALLVQEELSEAEDGPFTVTHVERLAEAILQLRTHHFGLVLLDLSLPDCDGIETFERMSAASAEVPVVILSGQSDIAMAVRAVRYGAQDYLVKGHLTDRFLGRSIRNAIDRKQNQEALRQLTRLLEGRNAELTARNEELLWKTAFFEAQVNSALDGILVLDGQGRKILQNQRMVDLWRIPPEFAEDLDDRRQFAWVITQNRNPGQFADKVRYLESHPDEISRDEIELLDGKILDRYSAPVLGPAGIRYGRIWAFRDVTEERLREDKLTKALQRERKLTGEAQAGGRAKSEFLATMSHEIRTPMNAILGFSELLGEAGDLPPGCRDYVDTITSSGEALLRIINDVLDYSSLEANELKVEPVAFSPREVLYDVHTLLAPRAISKHLDFRVLIDESLPDRLWNDPGRLRQVLLNLVGNAIKFTEKGSVVLGFAKAEGAPDRVDFYVRDTGPGIPQDRIDDIFRPFRQLDSSISRRYGGTGLGLSISRNLVELMGGTLTLCRGITPGADFRVTLPMVVPGGLSAPLQNIPPDRLDESFSVHHPLRLMLVEDDPINQKLMVLMLHKLGYEPLLARDGVEAVEIYRRDRPDCILMDLQMPRKDGLETTVEIRAIEREARSSSRAFIVALTANIVSEDRQHCFDFGMDAYLNKPLKRTVLASTLAQAASSRRR